MWSIAGEMSSIADEMVSTPARDETRSKASSRPVDLVHLSRYTLGERALEGEVLALFQTQAAVCLQRLGAAEMDREWKEAAHMLKGSARAIGAWRAGDAAERAEALSGTALAEGRGPALREFELAVGEAKAYIQTLLEDR